MSPFDPTAATSATSTDATGTGDLQERLRSLTPKAEGTLGRTPLLHQLVFALDRRLTGSTVLHSPNGHLDALVLHGGVPSKARTADTVAPLDRVLVHMGVLDAATLERTLRAISATKGLHGQYLLDQGLLDRPTLLQALTRQVLHKVTFMIGLGPDTSFAFYEGDNVLDGYGGPELTPTEPLSVIMAGVRTRPRDAVVDQTLARLGRLPLRLRPEADLELFGLTADERQVVDRLRRGAVPLPDLLQAGVAQRRVTELTVYALVITRCLDLGGNPQPPVGHDVPRSRRSSASAATTTPRRQRAAMRSAPADTSTHAGRRAAPLPRRGFATGQAGEVTERPSPEPRRALDTRPRPSSPSGRGAESRPRRGATTGRAPAPHQRDATSGGRGVAPLPRRGTRSTGVAPPAAARPQRSAAPTPERGKAKKDRPQLDAATIEQQVASLEGQDYFELLGLSRDATGDQVRAAFFELAKRWHPDRLGPALESHRASVAKIFAKLNEAHRTLSDDGKRKSYLERIASGADSTDPGEVERLVDAAQEYQQAEVLFKRGSLEQAADILRRCVAADPEPPEYPTLLAWVEAQLLGLPPVEDGRPDPSHYRRQLTTLNQVVAAHPEFERAIFYRAELLNRGGEPDKAIRDYRRAVELNPRNIDAKREVRLHELRKRQKADRDSGSGLFGRLFGQKKSS